MNFIIDLPKNVKYRETYDAIFVVINKPSKMCYYIFYYSNMTTRELVKVITQKVIQLHKMLLAIISDCRSLFTF